MIHKMSVNVSRVELWLLPVDLAASGKISSNYVLDTCWFISKDSQCDQMFVSIYNIKSSMTFMSGRNPIRHKCSSGWLIKFQIIVIQKWNRNQIDVQFLKGQSVFLNDRYIKMNFVGQFEKIIAQKCFSVLSHSTA